MTAAIALGAAATPPAQAAFGISESGFGFSGSDGSPAMLAGSHPFALQTTVAVNTKPAGSGFVLPDDEPKDVTIRFPPGMVGNPSPVPTCSAADFATIGVGKEFSACPASSAVGIAELVVGFGSVPDSPLEELFARARKNSESPVPVYNLKPPPGVASKIGFIALSTAPVTVETRLNPNPPYNLIAEATNISDVIQFYGSKVTLWGNPADAAHDPERGPCAIGATSCPVDLPEVPFLTLPTSCDGPLKAEFEADSWQNPGVWTQPVVAETKEGNDPIGLRECEKLKFEPTIDAKPTNVAAEGPTGLDFHLEFDDEGLVSPEGRAQSTIEKAVVTLPEGVTANPSVASGLATCSEAELAREGVNSAPGAGCPQASKIGAVEVETPLLEDKLLRGQVYLATQSENPFGTLLALYVVIREPELGIFVKLAGKVEPDPKTGQMVTTFGEPPYELPQVPFSHFRFQFREGGRSPLVTPPLCGTYETKAVLTPSSGTPPVTATSEFQISAGVNGGPCPPGGTPPFDPGFEAGSLNNQAGAHSPFYMRLTRADGEQSMTRFDAILPKGVTGKLAGLATCPQAAVGIAKAKSGRAELAAPSCPEASRIGRTLSGAGVGPLLTYVPGSLYLGGPYGGRPLSVIAIVPAVAGPFDVGTVVVQEALTLDPITAQVQVDGAASDPIPHILAGIPLKLRDLRVYVDRPQFTLNPTDCEPKLIGATLFGSAADLFSSADDVPAALSARFQAADCASLGFRPRLGLRLKGGAKRGDNPAFQATYRPRPGDANLEGLVLRLPRSAFLEQGHIRTICTRVQWAADACPPASRYGYIRAFTPLLDEPLQGPVYLRSSNNKLPDLVFDLRGIVRIEAVTRIDSVRGGIRATVLSAPDAPLTKVVVSMQGGQKGLIVNSRDLCAAPSRANVRFAAHNAKRHTAKPAMRAKCGKRKARSGRNRK